MNSFPNFNSGGDTRVLISREEIEKIVSELAHKINKEYSGREIIVVGVLKGSIVFMADLIQKLTMPLSLDFIEASSYEGREPTGQVNLKKDISVDIKGKDVLLVEDIVDTGNTMSVLLPFLLKRGPNSLRLVAFLDKPSRRKAPVNIDYIGKTIPDEFVVGYGLDYNGLYRNLPEVRVLER